MYWFLAWAHQICRETWQNLWGLGDEFYPKPLQGYGWCSQQRKLQRPETHRTRDESHEENWGWDDPGDDSYWWNAIRLCPWMRYNRCFIHHTAAPGEILVQERSQWQKPDFVLCFCRSGESIWPCPPKGIMVVYEKGGGRRVDNASITSYVQQCTQPSESRLWVQWGIWSWHWGPSGLCSQPSTFYHCAWGFI